jgi:hypothetical protein
MELINFNTVRSALGSFGFLADVGFWHNFYIGLRQILIAVSGGLFILSVWLLLKIWPLKLRFYVHEGYRVYRAPRREASFEEEQRLISRRKWDTIIKKVESRREAGYGMAIIEADILTEEIMGRMGFIGKNLAERLNSLVPGELESVNDLWAAHKLRNKIAHEPEFQPTKEETLEALATYRKALEELGAI